MSYERMSTCHVEGCEVHLGEPQPIYFTTADARWMRELHREGMATIDIAKLMDCQPATVRRLLKRDHAREWFTRGERKMPPRFAAVRTYIEQHTEERRSRSRYRAKEAARRKTFLTRETSVSDMPDAADDYLWRSIDGRCQHALLAPDSVLSVCGFACRDDGWMDKPKARRCMRCLAFIFSVSG